jgi:hypothetical protein
MKPHRYMTAEQRFEAQFIPVPEAGCWLWIGTLVDGYGQIQIEPGRRELAHRYALSQKLGRPLIDGALACHRCDTPSCVNPDHLYEGDVQTNADDAVARGRQTRGIDNVPPEKRYKGEHHHSAKLTAAEVLEIRAHRQSYSQLSKRFGISKTAVARIIDGRTWKHLTALVDQNEAALRACPMKAAA